MASQVEPADTLNFRGDKAQLAADGPAVICTATFSRAEAEQVVDNPSLNYERERLILDLDPVSVNLSARADTP